MDTPRGDADGRSPDDYVPGIKIAGAMNIESGVLPNSTASAHRRAASIPA
ncbi:MAG TPA: hypothetical protein VFV69_03785 [Steroidobacteraceae bacterium]|nr:hypothetical protein [Steroidobacteraceae bacterium]